MDSARASVEELGRKIFTFLARRFPIACASDEFYYFPQCRLTKPRWSTWDQFSSDSISETVTQLSGWENDLALVNKRETDFDTSLDISLLEKCIRTLREQLTDYRVWRTQPTFYLTLACLGLAEALESDDPSAIHDRAPGLPRFLDQAARNLSEVPVSFRDLGLEMVSDTEHFVKSLKGVVPNLPDLQSALDRFEEALKKTRTREEFILREGRLEHLVSDHINAGMDIKEVDEVLDQEIEEMQKVIRRHATNLLDASARPADGWEIWKAVYNSLPCPEVEGDSLVEFFKEEVMRLMHHCLEKSLVQAERASSCPVRVALMPPYLSAIRTASSYSANPGRPPSGGTFYIFQDRKLGRLRAEGLREYRMFSSHETYPGHHLLDMERLGSKRFTRMPVEQPIFYEGWACFAEEIMRLTGYFSLPGDDFLLAKRRFWRGVRGKVDLGLQSGKMNMVTAAKYLKIAGMSADHALSTARKYPLNPGYQLCYTLGLRRFLDLYYKYGGNRLPRFMQRVLGQGEISFTDLEALLIREKHESRPLA